MLLWYGNKNRWIILFRKGIGCLLFTLGFLFQFHAGAFARENEDSLVKWVAVLDNQNDTVNTEYLTISIELRKMDSAAMFRTMDRLHEKGAAAGPYFEARYNLLRGQLYWMLNGRRNKDMVSRYMKEGLTDAYRIGDEYLIASISWIYGELMYYSGDIDVAAMYCLNGAAILNKKGSGMNATRCWLAGEIFYYTRDYENAIYYSKKSIAYMSPVDQNNALSIRNTIGLCWQRLGNYDSAFYYYNASMDIANRQNLEVWKGIISGNKGQVYYQLRQYDTAKALLLYDYGVSLKYNELANSANSLQWAAKINVLQQNAGLALQQVLEAKRLLTKQSNVRYLENLYYTLADVYRINGKTDSFYYYSDLYIRLHDSLERAVNNSRVEISKVRLTNLENIFEIQSLHKQQEAEKLKRNFIIAAIVVLAGVALLYLNRQRSQYRLQEQLALQQKKVVENEMIAAKEQLQLFTQHLIDNNNIIEKLEGQLSNKQLTLEQQQLVDEMSRQTILTDEDWEKFKTLFQKIYPGFFLNLREKAKDITLAEQRMAALSRLPLTTKQMASILGISVDSVHKTRQRLRQRLQLDNSVNIESFLAEI